MNKKYNKKFTKSMIDSIDFAIKSFKEIFSSKLSKICSLIVAILIFIFGNFSDIVFMLLGMFTAYVMYKHYINKFINNYQFSSEKKEEVVIENEEVIEEVFNFDLINSNVTREDDTYKISLKDVVSLTGQNIEEINIILNYEKVYATINAFDEKQNFIFRTVKALDKGATLDTNFLIELINENC